MRMSDTKLPRLSKSKNNSNRYKTETDQSYIQSYDMEQPEPFASRKRSSRHSYYRKRQSSILQYHLNNEAEEPKHHKQLQYKQISHQNEDCSQSEPNTNKYTTENIVKLVEELKKKIELQNQQIANRNKTIHGLQKNFQTLSQFAKKEKDTAAKLKKQVAAHQTENNELTKQLGQSNKKLEEEYAKNSQVKHLKDQVQSLESQNKKLQGDIMKVDSKASTTHEKNQEEIRKLKDELHLKDIEIRFIESKNQQSNQKNHKYQEMEIQKLNEKLKASERQVYQLEASLDQYQTQVRSLRRELEKQKEQYTKQEQQKDVYTKVREQQDQKIKQQIKASQLNGQLLKKQIKEMKEIIIQQNRQIQQKNDLIHKLTKNDHSPYKQLDAVSEKEEQSPVNGTIENKSNEEEGDQEEIWKEYCMNLQKHKKQIEERCQQLEKKGNDSHRIQTNLEQKVKKLSQQITAKQSQKQGLLKELNNLSEKINQLEAEQKKNQALNEKYQKYEKYLDKIDSLMEPSEDRTQPAITIVETQKYQVLVDTQKQIQRENIKNNEKIQKLQNIVSLSQKYDKEQQKQIEFHRKNIESLQGQTIQLSQQLDLAFQENQSLKAEVQRLKQQIQLQKVKNINKKNVMKNQESKIKQLESTLSNITGQDQRIESLEAEIKVLKKNRQELESEIDSLISKNQDLWEDNRKLNNRESQRIKELEKQISQKQLTKQQEIRSLQKQKDAQMEKQINTIMKIRKNEENSIMELRNIIKSKNQDLKIITQNHIKATAETNFYKNRNKELQNLLTRNQNQSISQHYRPANHRKPNQYKSFNHLASLSKCQQQLSKKMLEVCRSYLCQICDKVVEECVRCKICWQLYCKKCESGLEKGCCRKSQNIAGDKKQEDRIDNLVYAENKAKQMSIELKQLSRCLQVELGRERQQSY